MDGPNDLLTTGQAAAIVGTTARHIVDLCDRGEIPYTTTGSHRRLRRADVEAFAARRAISRGGPMTEDQLRALWLGRVLAARVATDPDRVLLAGRTTAERLLRSDPAGARWLREWIEIIDRGPEAVMRALTSISPEARELRQNLPFAGVLGEDERRHVIEAFRRANLRAR